MALVLALSVATGVAANIALLQVSFLVLAVIAGMASVMPWAEMQDWQA